MKLNSDLFLSLRQFKSSIGIEIIDAHVHPLDVMGVIDFKKRSIHETKKLNLKVGLLELLQYGRMANFLSEPVSRLLPTYTNNLISSAFTDISESRILNEMDESCVDRVLLLPIEPWCLTETIAKNFKSDRFIKLGSINPNLHKIDQVEPYIVDMIREYHIVGIKLHPNLQDFYPYPGDNEMEVRLVLEEIYRVIAKYNLFIIMHAGVSFYSDKTDISFKKIQRSRRKGKLFNFSASIDFFSNLHTPIIISHLGHYGEFIFRHKLISKILTNNKIYFDTSGTSPEFILEYINRFGSDRLIFGSDAVYNSMKHNILFAFGAMMKSSRKDKELMFRHIFSENIKSILNT